MNAPVLALIGEIPDADIGRDLGHLHEIRDQAGIIARLVDHSALHPHARAGAAPRRRGDARRWPPAGPARPRCECAIDVWGKTGAGDAAGAAAGAAAARSTTTAIRKAAKLLGAAKNPMIVCGGGAQDASEEVTALSAMLQAPVLGYRRGRGVLDSRDPFSVTLPLGRELWGEADVVLGGRHAHADPAPAMGHGQRHRGHPRRCRRRGARPPAQARGRADRRRQADPAAPARRAARAQRQARLAQGRDGASARPPGASASDDDRRRRSPSSTRSAPNCPRTASSSTR